LEKYKGKKIQLLSRKEERRKPSLTSPGPNEKNSFLHWLAAYSHHKILMSSHHIINVRSQCATVTAPSLPSFYSSFWLSLHNHHFINTL